MIRLTSKPYLFIDDEFIDTTDSVRLELHHPQRTGPAFVFDGVWEGPSSTYCSIVDTAAAGTAPSGPFDGPRYRLYYRGMAGAVDLVGECTCVAESEDGLTFTRRPVWEYPVNGSTSNNVVWNGQHDISHNMAPFADTNPGCSSDARFKAIGGVSREKMFALASADGIHWRLMAEEPVLTEGDFDSLNVAFWDAAKGCYVAYVRKSHGGFRSVDRCTSDDFIHWSRPEPLDFGPGEPEQLYTNAIQPYCRNNQIYLGFPMRFFPERTRYASVEEKGVSDNVLIASRDGVSFPRHFREAFIRPGLDARNWTQRNFIAATGIIPVDDKQLALYWVEHYYHHDCQLMRGTIRVDGFTSLHAGVPGGELLSRPLKLDGNGITLNVATSAGGFIRVEICDESGRAIEGYSAAQCEEIYGDDIQRSVLWNRSPDLSHLAGATIRLRLAMKDADLFSLSASN